MTRPLLASAAALFLVSCAAPAPVVIREYVVLPNTPSTPAVKKKTTSYTSSPRTTSKPATTTTRQPDKPTEAGRVVDGRFIRDTPPGEIEPAKTIRVEKDF